jgi:Tfp pilus assembly protein PilV
LFRINTKHAAFGLLEVLISVVILSIGLLGLASLQSKSIQSLQEGDNLATASIIANDVKQRMLANPYITAGGRAGYLALDLSTDIATAGGVVAWADDTLTNNPDITRCYSVDATESCYADGATIGNSADHITALENLALMDQVETRQLAWNLLPDGEIKICFDSSNGLNSWNCDNTAVRVDARNENVFTVRVRWNNLFTDTAQVYSIQFTAPCTNSSSTYCGN